MKFGDRELLEAMHLVVGDSIMIDDTLYEIVSGVFNGKPGYGYAFGDELPTPIVKLLGVEYKLLTKGQRNAQTPMRLETSNHAYSCDRGGNCEHVANWKEFVKHAPSDHELNFLYRFDILFDEGPIENAYSLELHYVLQRHGSSVSHIVVDEITEKDIPEIENYLRERKAMVSDMWKEVPLLSNYRLRPNVNPTLKVGDSVLYDGVSSEIIEIVDLEYGPSYHISNKSDIDAWVVESDLVFAGL